MGQFRIGQRILRDRQKRPNKSVLEEDPDTSISLREDTSNLEKGNSKSTLDFRRPRSQFSASAIAARSRDEK